MNDIVVITLYSFIVMSCWTQPTTAFMHTTRGVISIRTNNCATANHNRGLTLQIKKNKVASWSSCTFMSTGGNLLLKSSSSSLSSVSSSTNDQPTKLCVSEKGEEEEERVLLTSIGVPDSLKSLQIGQYVEGFRRATIQIEPLSLSSSSSSSSSIQTIPSNFTIHKVSDTPNVFILRNFLSTYECDSIISHVSNDEHKLMSNAETITKNDTTSRKKCKVAWIPSSSSSSVSLSISKMISNLVSSTANILLSKQVLMNPTAGVEDLQVLKYDVGGEFVLHHDGEPRILTVIYYVNGVGGTWFPLAQTSHDPLQSNNINEEKFAQDFIQSRKETPMNKAQALEFGKGFQPGKEGLLIKGCSNDDGINDSDDNPHIAYVRKGDAIAFFNYKNDGSGQLDWRALHTGLPTTEEDGVKWIANHWFRVGQLSDY